MAAAAAVAVMSWSWGCSDEPGANAGAGDMGAVGDMASPNVAPGPGAWETFQQAMVITFCDAPYQCPTYSPPRGASRFGSLASCREGVAEEFVPLLGAGLGLSEESLNAAIEAGRVVFDADVAARCLAQLEEDPCVALQGQQLVGECASIFTGTVAPGGACTSSPECAGDLSCYFDEADGMCRGRCMNLRYSSCQDAGLCEPDEYCDEGQCKEATIEEGEACQPGQCRPGLSCSFDEQAGAGSCQPVGSGQEGTPCANDALCDEGLACLWDSTVGTMACKAAIAVGEFCDPSRGSGGCEEGAECFETGAQQYSCVARYSVAEGQRCSYALCQRGLVCLDGLCTERIARKAGESCDEQVSVCEGGLVCARVAPDDEEGTCQPPAETGESCGEHDTCAWELQCAGLDDGSGLAGMCAPRLNTGASCTSGNQCASAYCDRPAGQVEGTCQPAASQRPAACR